MENLKSGNGSSGSKGNPEKLLHARLENPRGLNEREPDGLNPGEPGAKMDADKPKAFLMLSGFGRALLMLAEITTYGAKKYSPKGWEHVRFGHERYCDAAARHLLMIESEWRDEESGFPHLAMAGWNILAALELWIRRGEPIQGGINKKDRAFDEIELRHPGETHAENLAERFRD